MPPSKKLVVGPRGAAELLDLSQWSVYKLINSGELESFALGSSRRITVESIEAYIARRLDQPKRKIRTPPIRQKRAEVSA
jgi:excisionase family DNA binding protein